MIAMLWATSGSLFCDNLAINPYPSPPPWLNVAVQTWELRAMWTQPNADDESYPVIHTAQFTLKDWSPSGEVAHYELSNRPPKGWEWLIQKDKFIARKLPLDKPNA